MSEGLGDRGERLAEERLLALGWTIVTRRYKVRGGEIDLVALDGDVLVFVEVKTRSATSPEEALTARKADRLRVAARAYLNAVGRPDAPHRFDLVAIEGVEIRHHQSVLDSVVGTAYPRDGE